MVWKAGHPPWYLASGKSQISLGEQWVCLLISRCRQQHAYWCVTLACPCKAVPLLIWNLCIQATHLTDCVPTIWTLSPSGHGCFVPGPSSEGHLQCGWFSPRFNCHHSYFAEIEVDIYFRSLLLGADCFLLSHYCCCLVWVHSKLTVGWTWYQSYPKEETLRSVGHPSLTVSNFQNKQIKGTKKTSISSSYLLLVFCCELYISLYMDCGDLHTSPCMVRCPSGYRF